jgi:hypothetical protein
LKQFWLVVAQHPIKSLCWCFFYFGRYLCSHLADKLNQAGKVIFLSKVQGIFDQSNVLIKPLLHQQMSQCAYIETQPKTPMSTQCRCRSTVARKNSLGRQEKPREEPGFEGWPVLFWLCPVEIKRVHGHKARSFLKMFKWS